MKERKISPEANKLLEQMMHEAPRLAQVSMNLQEQTTPDEIREILDQQIMTKSLGGLLRQARENRKLSTRAMAERIGISQPRVVAVEKAQTQLEIETLVRFAAAAQYRVAVQLIPIGEPGVSISVEL